MDLRTSNYLHSSVDTLTIPEIPRIQKLRGATLIIGEQDSTLTFGRI